ncbi:MAG: ADP-forming succinate--CoA ligase subunit beta [Polyangia bacterium]|jgi:succinyl-CoA synthetase beta subunit|nr:ADP-forming succinate--CoA ligase subunit beta [Polyangia bacterium]
MKIHEYQAKEILRSFGVATPLGGPATTAGEAFSLGERIASETGSEVLVVKAQIHAGGRGKGRFLEDPSLGGVQVVKGAAAARDMAARMLGKTLRTHQTGPEGKQVSRILVEQGVEISRELYLGMVLDRAQARVTIMASTEGGTEIEEVAARTPEKILKRSIDPAIGFQPYLARELAYGLGLEEAPAKNAAAFMAALARAYEAIDASLAEINPLVVTRSGEVLALDAKVNLDDNALFRHAEHEALRDPSEEDPAELEGKRWGLSFIKLYGSIGCMVNGAGLAMSTMDIIKQAGGEPANFLDVGGGAKADQVAAAFKIITRDPNVKGIFINIFGGIMRCDTLAEGVVAAVREVGLGVPLVVRLEGTNVELGRKILAESGMDILSAEDMADGAKKIVEQTR